VKDLSQFIFPRLISQNDFARVPGTYPQIGTFATDGFKDLLFCFNRFYIRFDWQLCELNEGKELIV